MIPRLLLLFTACAPLALGQFGPAPGSKAESTDEKKPDAPADAQPVKPSVKKLDATRYQVGEVIFDQKTREIRFPAAVNMTEGQLEFLIVHKNGKTHESLLSTGISPLALNLAFTLLRYKPSRELYPLPNDTGGTSDKFPEVPEEVKTGARIAVDVEYKDGEKDKRLPLNEWIQHGTKLTAMPAGPWVYGASEMEDGKYAAESTGDIVAIYLSLSSIINYPGDDNNNDDVWTPFPKRVPTEGTPVTVIISPYQKDKPVDTEKDKPLPKP